MALETLRMNSSTLTLKLHQLDYIESQSTYTYKQAQRICFRLRAGANYSFELCAKLFNISGDFDVFTMTKCLQFENGHDIYCGADWPY